MGYEKRAKMSAKDRAKQFLPFSAVRGLEEALARKREELYFEEKTIISPDREAEIDSTLRSLSSGMTAEVCYYESDASYLVKGKVISIDRERKCLTISDKCISFDSITSVTAEDINNE